jgi:hypothetical protein
LFDSFGGISNLGEKEFEIRGNDVDVGFKFKPKPYLIVVLYESSNKELI